MLIAERYAEDEETYFSVQNFLLRRHHRDALRCQRHRSGRSTLIPSVQSSASKTTADESRYLIRWPGFAQARRGVQLIEGWLRYAKCIDLLNDGTHKVRRRAGTRGSHQNLMRVPNYADDGPEQPRATAGYIEKRSGKERHFAASPTRVNHHRPDPDGVPLPVSILNNGAGDYRLSTLHRAGHPPRWDGGMYQV